MSVLLLHFERDGTFHKTTTQLFLKLPAFNFLTCMILMAASLPEEYHAWYSDKQEIQLIELDHIHLL